jgi:Zn ribbon nucleic-acid-binding protein
MIHCPHCQAKANLSKVIVSSKKRPYVCPSCGEYAELARWQTVVLILLVGVGFAAQLDDKQVDKLVGSGSGVFLLSILLAWLFLKYCCHLSLLDSQTMAQRSKSKVSWVFGGPITSTNFLVYAAGGCIAALCYSYFFVHRPLNTIVPVMLISAAILGVVYWIRFRR